MQLEVGKPYQEGINRIPEGIVFDFNQSGGFLRIVFDSPLDNEIGEIKQGKIKLGLLEKDGIIFFFVKFGSMAWMDAPYDVGFSQPFKLEELMDEKNAVQIVLIDGMTGLIVALKSIELPHSMSNRLKELVAKQMETPIRDYEKTLNRIYAAFSTDDLVKIADKYML
jgi:hypothetical protein